MPAVPAKPPADPALDPAAVQRLREDLGGDEATLRDILDTFAAEAPKLLARLRQGLAAGDAAGASQAAHALKGAAGDVGARGLQDLARALETALRGGDLAAAAPLLPAAEAEWGRVQAALPGALGARA